jgi:hypothetical protein
MPTPGPGLYGRLIENMSRREGKSLWLEMLRRAADLDIRTPQRLYYGDRTVVGIDPASPESDKTVTALFTKEGKLMVLDCVAACLPQPLSCDIADAAFGTKAEIKPEVPSFDIDRAWDMVVLAARTSRYSED